MRRLIRLLYYLPMERMGKENKKSELEKELVYKPIYLPVRFFKKEAYIHIDDYKEAISKRENAINGLEEENKNLKRELEDTKQVSERDYNIVQNDNNILRNENKKLKEYNGELIENHKKDISILCEENKKLKKYYYRDKEELMESCYGLAKENEKLKSDLEECECSFGFESDEVGFWKREYKRLKKWIKDHCKGYGNLFPEDEMKRQWKKADKKRK